MCGMNDGRIQRVMLQEPILTYDRELELAQSIEGATEDVQRLQPSLQQVHQVHRSQPRNQSGTTPKFSPCYRCGATDHLQSSCRFRMAICRHCGKKGHIQNVCRSKQLRQAKPQQNPVHLVSKDSCSSQDLPTDQSSSQETDTYSLFTLQGRVKPIMVSVQVNQSTIEMEVDTGAALSLVNEDTFSKISTDCHLKPTKITLKTYIGEILRLLGATEVDVQYQSHQAKLPLLVVQGTGPDLLGRNWLQSIQLNWG